MSKKYKSTKRCYLIDHHSPQPPTVPLGNMDIGEYADFFDTAGIDSLMVYCKDHWGLTYYDSKVEGAQKHLGVQGDWIRKKRDMCTEKGIEFVAYYCIEYDEGAARRFPVWRARQADGSPLIRDDQYAKWSILCTRTGYREYALSQLEEIVSNYRPDALFLDIFGTSLCYCEACRAAFLHAYGYALPETPEGVKLHRGDITAFLDKHTEHFFKELSARLKRIEPELAITINFACHYADRVRELLDYQYSEPLLKDNWFSSAYARDTAVGQYPMLAPGEASAVYNYDSEAQYICDLSSIAAQGCRVGMYSGSQHIDGTLEHEEARRLGAAFAALKKLEPYFTDTRKPVKCVGIIQSDASKAAGADTVIPDAILRMKRKAPHTTAILGAMMMCEQAKIPYQVLPESRLSADTLRGYELILMPEVYVVSETLAESLAEYVKGGGRLMLSGRTGTLDAAFRAAADNPLSGLIGCTYVKEHGEYRQNGWSAYLKPCKPGDFCGLLSVTTPPVSEFFVETKAKGAKPLATFTLPAVACTPTEWVNWWSPPPGAATDIPAITLNSVGRGKVVYLAFDYFTMAAAESFRDSAGLFRDLVKILDVRPPVCNRTPYGKVLRTAFFEEEGSYHIHQISTIPNRYRGEALPISGGRLVFTKAVSRAYAVYPQREELAVQSHAGCWEVELPAFELQQFIIVEK